MLPFVNKPIMAHTIEHLAKHGITEVVAILYHQPEKIMEYFGDGSAFGVKMSYVVSPHNFGTAGAVKYAAANFDETFIVLSADVICDFDLTRAIDFHKAKKANVTMTLTRVENPLPYGIVITDKEGKINHFIEKPSWGEVISDTINTGIYIINPLILDRIPSGKEVDFSKDLFPKLLEERESLYGWTADGYWKDIGGLSEYSSCHKDVASGKIKINYIRQGQGIHVAQSSSLIGLVILGEGCEIGENCVIENSVIGKNCRIAANTRISESVLWDNVKIGKDSDINRAVVASDTSIGERSILEEGSVIAGNCSFGSDTHVKPYVKVWPGKKVDEGSTVSTSIVWRERWTKKVFGSHGVTGLCNVEITPEFAASLGAAYGVMLGKGAHITASRGPHRASRMIYRALLSGVLSAGVNVSDLEMVPIPINRYELKAVKSNGGFHVRKSPFDDSVIDIKFFDIDGLDLSASREKVVERLFFGDDYERASVEETGELSFPFYKVAERYKEEFLNCIDRKSILDRKFKFVIDYAFGSVSQIFPSILGEMGCEAVALNAHVNESKITKNKDEFEKSLCELSQIVTTLNGEFGVLFDAGAEKVFLSDEKGHILSGDVALALMSYLSVKHNARKTIATPVTSSRVIEEIAESYNGRVIRTKTSTRALMEASSYDGVSFVGERTGGFIFPKFQVSFDSMFSVAKLLQYLLMENRPMSEILRELPRIFIGKNDIHCPNNLKGKVMRSLIEENISEHVELIDGIKIFSKKDWALILPHNDSPSIRLQVESSSEEGVKKLMDFWTGKIYDICR
jgi:mannose-1-phosphate guanylyltransferase/phosphomannomutase